MNRRIVVCWSIVLVCLVCGFLAAQDAPAPDDRQKTEDAVKGIAGFPAETQGAILEICQKPELITEMAKTKALPDLQGCTDAVQKAATLLERYPDIIETLNSNLDMVKMVGTFYAKSPTEALDLVKKGAQETGKGEQAYIEEAVKGVGSFPPEMQTAILEISQKPDLITEMAKTKALPDMQGCSDAIQKAAKDLLAHPEIIESLSQNMETVAMVGSFYAKSPTEALELVKKGAADAQEGSQAQVEEAVKGIASFPPEMQTAILEIAQKPDLIAEMARTKALPDLQGCSDAVQKAAKDLLAHPDIVQTLSQNIETVKAVGSFYAQSPTEALALVKKGAEEAGASSEANIQEAIEGIASYPPETRTAILEICQKPELIAEMAKTKKLPDLQGCSEAIQNAAKHLVEHPEVVATLNEHMETAKMVGDFYAKSPAEALQLVNKAAEDCEKENQNNKEEWIKTLKANSKALEQYRDALRDFNKKQAEAQPGAPAPDASLQAEAADDSVTVYSAPSPEVVDYITVNADIYPDIASQVVVFWGRWPYWSHWRPWYPWRPWPYPVYWPGPWRHPWYGPWHHPWWGPWHHPIEPWRHNPWGPYYHPYGPWHHAWGPGPHPWPHPWPDHHPPLAPLAPVHKPVGPVLAPLAKPGSHAIGALLKPGSQAPLAMRDLHGLASPSDLAKNPKIMSEWANMRKESPLAERPLTEDKERIQNLVGRRDEYPNLTQHIDSFGDRHPDHPLNEWRQNPRPFEGRDAERIERPERSYGERPISLQSGEYSHSQRMSSAMHEHNACWGGMPHGGRSFGGGGRSFGGGGRRR
ncbi:MAG: hypothetical protein AB1696_10375 [Planctomycetota bacterium]